MKIVIVESDACPFEVGDLPYEVVAEADLIVERFSPFCPFVIKDRYGDTELVEWRRRWRRDAKSEMYPLPAASSRAKQARSNTRKGAS